MLRFGIVSQINSTAVQARVSFEEDNSTSYWLPVLQTKTLKDKFYVMPDIGEQVACLMDENSEDGVILGSIYSSADTPKTNTEQEFSMILDNGSSVKVNKEAKTLEISFENIKLVGNIEHTGTFTNTNGIKSNADITDKTSSMQGIRDIYNNHTHPDKNQKTTSNM